MVCDYERDLKEPFEIPIPVGSASSTPSSTPSTMSLDDQGISDGESNSWAVSKHPQCFEGEFDIYCDDESSMEEDEEDEKCNTFSFPRAKSPHRTRLDIRQISAPRLPNRRQSIQDELVASQDSEDDDDDDFLEFDLTRLVPNAVNWEMKSNLLNQTESLFLPPKLPCRSMEGLRDLGQMRRIDCRKSANEKQGDGLNRKSFKALACPPRIPSRSLSSESDHHDRKNTSDRSSEEVSFLPSELMKSSTSLPAESQTKLATPLTSPSSSDSSYNQSKYCNPPKFPFRRRSILLGSKDDDNT